MKKRKAFSLAEVLVALFILSITMGSIANLFLSAKRYGRHSICRIQAANFGKYLLDNLQMCVRQSETSPGANNGWDQPNNCLTAGTYNNVEDWNPPEAKNIWYHSDYEISDKSLSPPYTLRKVKLTIRWIEPAPWAIY